METSPTYYPGTRYGVDFKAPYMPWHPTGHDFPTRESALQWVRDTQASPYKTGYRYRLVKAVMEVSYEEVS